MKFRNSLFVLFISCFSATALGQQAKLEGQVFDDKNRAVVGVRIVAAGGQSAVTDRKGHFKIGFPISAQPGQATRIQVVKSNWVVFQPMLGNCVTQSAERNYEPLRVVIVPKGSPLALSPKRLSQVIAQWTAERAKLRVEVGNLQQELDEYAFLQQYAKEYGFTLEQFRDAAERWAQIKESDDKEERALKEYWQKNYGKAAQLALESAQVAGEELKQANNKTNEASLKVIRRYKLAGNAYYAQYNFREALDAYNKIEKRFDAKELSKEIFIAEWAEMNFLIGNAKVALGVRVAGDENSQLLKEALANYQQSFTIYTRDQLPKEWAATQNSVGNVLLSLGVRARGAESVKYLNDSEAAYRTALEVATREKLPHEWAKTQNNLGIMLRSLGERASAEEGVKHLNNAITAFRAALEVRTREQLPEEWAATQTNLGNTLQSLGVRVGGAEGVRYLKDAIKAFRAALEVRTREKLPQEWAASQTNLGNALWALGLRVSVEEGINYLKDALALHRTALEVRSREKLPQDWAATQNNVGIVLASTGERLSGAASIKQLKDAVGAFRAALEVRTREHLPQDWAITQSNMGGALLNLGLRISGEEGINYLKDAAAAHRAALEVVTREQLPQQWASRQANLGSALQYLAERVSDAEGIKYLKEAVEAHQSALEVRTRERLPPQWATTQNNLGNTLRGLGERVEREAAIRHLKDATIAHRAALEVFRREDFPQQWAITQNNLARDYVQLHDWPAAAEAYTNVLSLDRGQREAYDKAASIYHDILFKFDKAFDLHQQWLAQHTEDISAQINYAEAHFSVGRFAECEQRVNALLTNPRVPVSTKTALRATKIASLLADGKASQVPVNLDALIAEVAGQPAAFKVEWVFDGTRHFIDQNEKLSSYRAWLGRLFVALASKDRDTMLKALQNVRANYKEQRSTTSFRLKSAWPSPSIITIQRNPGS
ncbi:MAG TPA: hypothetical protein VFX97_01395 [Pyrinomonadaceae bacterium]|nr:hypothetical protein [Pyrinomonadaceae bacterium]